MTENSQQRVAWPVSFGNAPKDGSRAMMQALNFALESPVGVNLTYEQESGRLEFVQSIYVDNSNNTATLTATFQGTQQTISVPAGYQAYLPVLATLDNPKMSFATTGTPTVNIWLLSFPMAPAEWPASAAAAATSSTSAANSSGGVSTYAALGGTGNALLTSTPVLIKSGATNLYGVNFVNKGASDAYVQIFDALAATLGTTVPKMSLWVPAGGAWEEKYTNEAKISFATGLLVAATGTATGGTSPIAGILGNIMYK